MKENLKPKGVQCPLSNDAEIFKYKSDIVLHDLGLVIIHNTYLLSLCILYYYNKNK